MREFNKQELGMRIAMAVLGICFGIGQASAATFVVDTTQAGDSVFLRACTSAPADCSFRGALLNANANVDLDTVAFNIPANEDSGCSSVTGICTLPSPGNFTSPYLDTIITGLNSELIIDGYTQAGATPNTLSADGNGVNTNLKIELGQSRGLVFTNAATIKGIAFFNEGGSGGPAGSKYFDNDRPLIFEGSYLGARADGTLSTESAAATTLTVAACLLPNFYAAQGSNQVRIGGTLPAQRNWLPRGVISLNSCVSRNNNQYTTDIQGNLFGTSKSGGFLEANSSGITTFFGSMQPAIFNIGGVTPSARNVFLGMSQAIIASPPGLASNVTTVRGNYFGVAADGTPTVLPFQPTASITGARIIVGGAQLGEANIISVGVLNFGEASLQNALNMSVLTNQYVRAAVPLVQLTGVSGRVAMFSGDSSIRINDPGDLDGGGGGHSFQNYPEISAFNVLANDLAINYKVDSLPANSDYPLSVEFYRTDALATYVPKLLLGRDVYTAAEAGTNKAINLTLPAGHNVTNDDVIIAIATQANEKGSSNFSWYPVNLTFVGNQGGFVNTPVAIKVRLQGLVARPRGEVRVDFVGSPGFVPAPCFLSLAAVAASPLLAEGTCTVNFPFQGTIQVNAGYLGAEQSFHAIDGTAPTATRQITISPAQTPDIFCHGFEDSSNGSCRALP
jgi:hypothetical protein